MSNVLNNLLKLEKNVCHKKTLHLWPGGCKMPCRQLQLSDIECSQVCGKLEGKAGSGLILGLTLGYVIFGYWPLNHLMGSRIESEKLEDWLMIDLHPKLWLSYHKRFEENTTAPWHDWCLNIMSSPESSQKRAGKNGWWPRHWIAVVPKIVEQHVIAEGSKNESNKLLSKFVAIRLETCRLLVATWRYQKHPETSNLEVNFIIFYQPTWTVKSH